MVERTVKTSPYQSTPQHLQQPTHPAAAEAPEAVRVGWAAVTTKEVLYLHDLANDWN